jgi:hypothetical protein
MKTTCEIEMRLQMQKFGVFAESLPQAAST